MSAKRKPVSCPAASPTVDVAARVAELEAALHAATTARLAAEKSLRRAGAEREALAREAHRRVKNNLQVIASLLDMQRRRLREGHDAGAADALLESRNRIEAIATIHDVFHRLRAFDRLDIGPYVRALLTDLIQLYGTLYAKVGVELRVETRPRALKLPASCAVPVGLIVNELVSNSLKHAFPGDRGGHVEVLLSRRGDVILLEVADDGVGLPPDIEERMETSLGFTIVATQVKQLGGELAFGRGSGTRLRVAFVQREA